MKLFPLTHIPRIALLNLLAVLILSILFLVSCSSSGKKSTPNKFPSTSLTATPKNGESALEVTFNATMSDPDGDNLTVEWDFGDGKTEKGGKQKKHTYQSEGNYLARVIVYDDKGGSAVDSTKITVTAKNNAPEVLLSADETIGTAPMAINFTANASDIDGDDLIFLWDFGDGQTLNLQNTEEQKQQSHMYESEGIYTAKIIVSDSKGNSASDSIKITIESPPNRPPTVSLNATPINGVVPLSVEFTAIGSDPDGNTLTYSWDFGDGNEAGNRSKEAHIYKSTGTFTAKVTVSDGKGGTANKALTITVKEAPPNKPPTLLLNATPTNGETPLEVKFTASTSDPDGDTLTYAWDFGDGDKANGESERSHTYHDKGNYIAKVTVSDGKGGKITDSIEIKVNQTPTNNPPTVKLIPSKIIGNIPLTVTFTATASDLDDDTLSYDWDFGDGETAQGETSRDYTYQNDGTFTVKVSVSDGKGGTDSDTIRINVIAADGGDAQIQCIQYDPPIGNDAGNEYVDVKALEAVDFSGWYVEDAAGNRVSAPKVMATLGQIVRFQNDKAIWNDDGDAAWLYNSKDILKDRVSYSGGGNIACR